MTIKKKTVTDAINLTKTQDGWAPLADRFKSFPADSQKAPVNDAQFYFENRANQTLEKATIDLLFPIPPWLRLRKNKAGLEGFYRTVVDGKIRVSNTPTGTRYRVGTEPK